MHEIKFSIKTLSPVVISAASNSTLMTESHDEISGSIVRGMLAKRYIRENNLDNTAHTNKDFLKLFYGDLKFLSAMPAIAGKRSFILPLSLQRGKKGTANEKKIADLLKEIPPAGYKSLRGYGIVDGDKILTASVEKNIYMHMSRSADNERISGKSEEGHIYNYEALEAGQIFSGAILGAADLLEELNLANETFIDNIGRSRFTQYGKCEFTFGEVTEVENPNFGEKIYLRLESPLVPLADNFISAAQILQSEVINKLGANFSLGKVFAAGTEVENFVSVWGMKRPRVMALAAGTVFEINAENLTDDDKNNLREKIYSGFGFRTEEGFGQLRIWNAGNFTLEKLNPEIIKPEFSDQTKEIAKNILLEKYLEQLRILAQEDANKLTNQLQRGNFTHFFSRLSNILATVIEKTIREKFKEKISAGEDANELNEKLKRGNFRYFLLNSDDINSSVNKKNVREKFKDKIEFESTDGTLFQDNLKKLYIGEQKLFDVLKGNANLPYEEKNLLAVDIKKLFGEIGFNVSDYNDIFCFEYLQNFFRAARKIAALKGGDKND